MKKRIGILTSGGDCQSMNATIHGTVRACQKLFGSDGVDFIGIEDGYYGLIHNQAREMTAADCDELLTKGGTLLGSRRTPSKKMTVVEEDGVNKVEGMLNTYKLWGMTALLVLGGNGSHKTAHLLSENGLNVLGIPSTIDNDVAGTDMSIGYPTALEVGTDTLDRVNTTAFSHKRAIVAEIMGNKSGCLALNIGIAGGSDIILLPEIPFSERKVAEHIKKLAAAGQKSMLITIAEGAITLEEAAMKKKDRAAFRESEGYVTLTNKLVKYIQANSGVETRGFVPGHMLRGGTPSAYDRILAVRFGERAAALIASDTFGRSIGISGTKVVDNAIVDIVGKPRLLEVNCQEILAAKNMGICFGD